MTRTLKYKTTPWLENKWADNIGLRPPSLHFRFIRDRLIEFQKFFVLSGALRAVEYAGKNASFSKY